MVEPILVSIGILIMVISVLLCYKLIIQIPNKTIRIYWGFLFFLIFFFLIGYIIYLSFLLNEKLIIKEVNMLISMILCFGSLFVFLVIIASYKAIYDVEKHQKKLKEINKNLEQARIKLRLEHEDLLNTKKTLEEKNKQLENVMEDFYSLRIKMEENSNSNKIKKENIQIKKKLDNIKRKK